MEIKVVLTSSTTVAKRKEKELNDFLNNIEYNARSYALKELAMLGLEMKKEVESKFYQSLKAGILSQVNSTSKQHDIPTPHIDKQTTPPISPAVPNTVKADKPKIDEKLSITDKLLSLGGKKK